MAAPTSGGGDDVIVAFLEGLSRVLANADQMQPEAMKAAVDRVIAQHPEPPRNPSLSAREQARELMENAWQNPGPGTRMALDALRLDADCTDAWVYLGYDAGDEVDLALVFFTLGLMAGQRELGEETMERLAGQYWSSPETRPFMRALEGVARAHWDMGENTAAALYFAELLNLNPKDDQGARYPLLWISLERGDHEVARQVLDTFPGDALTPMTFGRALLAFRTAGPGSPEAHSAMQAILRAHAEVAAYLAGEKQLPAPDSPLALTLDDAVLFVPMMGEAWEATPGATEWLRNSLRAGAPAGGLATPSATPTSTPATAPPAASPAAQAGSILQPPPTAPAKERRSGPRSLE